MNKSLLMSFVKQDLVDRYAGSLLGGLWAFVLPLVNILIFTLIFSKVMGMRLEGFGADFSQYNYSIYLVSGVLAWNAFSATVNRVTAFFHDRAGMISKVSVNLQLLPVYVLISEVVVYAISMIFFMLFLAYIGYPITIEWMWLPFVFAIQQLFAYAIGFTCAWLSVFVRDVKEIVPVVLQLWFWCTPIVYVAGMLPDSIQIYFDLNPLFAFINLYRQIIIEHNVDGMGSVLLWGAGSITVLFLSLWLFSRLERDIRDFI